MNMTIFKIKQSQVAVIVVTTITAAAVAAATTTTTTTTTGSICYLCRGASKAVMHISTTAGSCRPRQVGVVVHDE